MMCIMRSYYSNMKSTENLHPELQLVFSFFFFQWESVGECPHFLLSLKHTHTESKYFDKDLRPERESEKERLVNSALSFHVDEWSGRRAETACVVAGARDEAPCNWTRFLRVKQGHLKQTR